MPAPYDLTDVRAVTPEGIDLVEVDEATVSFEYDDGLGIANFDLDTGELSVMLCASEEGTIEDDAERAENAKLELAELEAPLRELGFEFEADTVTVYTEDGHEDAAANSSGTVIVTSLDALPKLLLAAREVV